MLETVLYSRDNLSATRCPKRGMSEEFSGLSILAVSIVDKNTSIIVYPGSHDSALEREFRPAPVRLGLEVGDIVFIHAKLIYSLDGYVESNLCIQHTLIAYSLLDEWELTSDRTDNAIETLVEWSMVERRGQEVELAQEREIGFGVNEAHAWLAGVPPLEEYVLIRGRDVSAMMEAELEEGEWSD